MENKKKQVKFNIKVRFKTIPNRESLIQYKHMLWWTPQEYYYNRCVMSNEIRYFMKKHGYTDFKKCSDLFWDDYTGSALIL